MSLFAFGLGATSGDCDCGDAYRLPLSVEINFNSFVPSLYVVSVGPLALPVEKGGSTLRGFGPYIRYGLPEASSFGVYLVELESRILVVENEMRYIRVDS